MIHWICRNESHYAAGRISPDAVRHFREQLAYCPSPAEDGHDWYATGGVPLWKAREMAKLIRTGIRTATMALRPR